MIKWEKRILSVVLVLVFSFCSLLPVSAMSSYTVKSGDVLWKIAQQFGLTYQEIAEANNLSDPNKLFLGQQLVIPDKQPAAAPAAVPAPAPVTAPAAATAPAYDPEIYFNNGGFNVPGLTFQPSMPDTKGSRFEPVEVFENVYFIGDTWVCCLLYVTPDGIIMWDALEGAGDMTSILQPDMEKLGLDIADIKVCLVSHGHGDHFGGARYLHDTYGTKIYMSEADLPTMMAATKPSPNGPPRFAEDQLPKIDEYLVDGGSYTLGGATFKFMATPGHTPGSMSFFVPVTDFNGNKHTLTCWGGTSAPRDAEGVKTYLASVQKYRNYINDNKVDSFLSMHPFVDYSTDNVKKVLQSHSSDALIRTAEKMDFFCQTLSVYTQMKGKLAAKGITQFTTKGFGSNVLSMPYIVYLPEDKNGNGAMFLGQNFKAEIFDDVYYVGNGTDATIIYNTKDGIVLSDAMTSESDFDALVKPAMESFGLDPKNIKAVMLSHGHADKYGFAAYLQKTYGAKIYMNKLDNSLAEESFKNVAKGKVTAIPTVDVDLAAGSYKFGEFTFDYVSTPGHTSGTMSYLVNVAIDGKTHTLANWGGTTFNYDKKMLEDYVKSTDSFKNLCVSKGADAIINTNPYVFYSAENVIELLLTGNKEAFILKGDNSVELALKCISLASQYKLKYLGK